MGSGIEWDHLETHGWQFGDRSSALPVPTLLFFVRGRREDVWILATAGAVPGGGWAHYDVSRDPWFRIAGCRDAANLIIV